MESESKINWKIIETLPQSGQFSFIKLVRELHNIPGFAKDPLCNAIIQCYRNNQDVINFREVMLVKLVEELFSRNLDLMDKLCQAVTEQRTVYLFPSGEKLVQKPETNHVG